MPSNETVNLTIMISFKLLKMGKLWLWTTFLVITYESFAVETQRHLGMGKLMCFSIKKCTFTFNISNKMQFPVFSSNFSSFKDLVTLSPICIFKQFFWLGKLASSPSNQKFTHSIVERKLVCFFTFETKVTIHLF